MRSIGSVPTASAVGVTIVTADKRVERLGSKGPVAVEVSQVGVTHTERRLRDLGARTQLRIERDGRPYVTDGGNAIIDCQFGAIDDPDRLDCRLQRVVGVFETGLFLGLCDMLVVGLADRSERVENPGRRAT